MEEFAGEFAGKVKVGKVDVRQASTTANQYQIQMIPTLVLFKNGQEIDRIEGAPSKSELSAWVTRVLKI